ncbi:MAG: toxin-activating lysine-acyltransferase [Phenylobacterium sp.]|uniref:toxin-activating lysine-acyltransferase n=1 Tax=Phenylobacterium sp. TaxID=1871053 RepID=UPI0027370DCD|nr:toxin-activating lysine-acyltransferase [Phenylobacterium sp.]MDP3748222.1 toxin-activating lysine-acyltransferase [Phenylobacterium sp.]
MSDNLKPPSDAASPKTVAQVLGEVTWLLTQSPSHRQLFIGDLEWLCMPALLLEQFRMYNGDNSPAAVALWAFVSEDTESRLIAGATKLRPDEWRNGDRAWLIELVAPFGGEDRILADLATTIFKGQPFKFHHLKDGVRAVTTIDPADLQTTH